MGSRPDEPSNVSALTTTEFLKVDAGDEQDGTMGATSRAPPYHGKQDDDHTAYTKPFPQVKDLEALSKGRSLQFCTQRCLLGLSRGEKMDNNCSNYMAHCQGKFDQKHLINRDELKTLFINQVKENQQKCCTPMELGGIDGPGKLRKGAKHTIFSITLEPFQYVLVGKGTGPLTCMLMEEATMYDRLCEMQGTRIPVYLGSIQFGDVLEGCHDDIRHMILLSYGGRRISRTEAEVNSTAIYQFRMQDLRQKGVFLSGIERRNVLWSTELDRLVFIGFERAELDPDEWDSDEWG